MYNYYVFLCLSEVIALPKKKITKFDLILISFLIISAMLLALRPFFSEKQSFFTVTTPDFTENFSLQENFTKKISSRGIDLELSVENGEVWVVNSSCPDGVCVSSGKISRSGEAIVCVPAEIIIEIGGQNEEENAEDIIIG